MNDTFGFSWRLEKEPLLCARHTLAPWAAPAPAERLKNTFEPRLQSKRQVLKRSSASKRLAFVRQLQ